MCCVRIRVNDDIFTQTDTRPARDVIGGNYVTEMLVFPIQKKLLIALRNMNALKLQCDQGAVVTISQEGIEKLKSFLQ
jgi:hypothetical protein